jgi:S-formylglutathione hydrolase FrmB
VIRALTAVVTVVVVLAGCGGGALAKPPDGLEVADLTIDSAAVDRPMKVKVVVPAGADGERRPLLVFLHGRGGNERSSLRRPMFAALKALGTRAPIVAFPDGGDHSYWHDRDSGAWGRYVMKEVIPQVAHRFGADPRRVAIGGISMGGFGAYDLARAHPKRFCAVGGHSPAVWRRAGETAPGAFDDAADFARHDVIAGAGRLAGRRVWLDAGERDPFRPGDRAFGAALRAAGAHVTVRTWPGGHDSRYWDRHWRDYLRFYARALSRC